MEQEPTQPIPVRHEHLTAVQEAHARRHIEKALDALTLENPIISTETARVIAATLHPGKGSILEHFAATGHLNPEVALDEINRIVGSDPNSTWLDALRWHVDEIVNPSPDRRPPDFKEPAPALFVSSPDSANGQWISLLDDWKDIAAQLGEIDQAWLDRTALDVQIRGDLWTFGNAVGLHGVDLSQSHNLSQARRIARGIDRYGEAYAAYVKSFGADGASRLRYVRVHAGSFDNITECVEAYARAQGLLPGSSADTARLRGPIISARLVERSLRENFLVVEGRSQIHMFERPYRPDSDK